MTIQNPNVQTKKMLSIEVHHSLHNCSIFRTIGLDVDSSDQIVLTSVALMVLLWSVWTSLNRKCAMIRSLLLRMPTNTVGLVVVCHFAVTKNKQTKKNVQRIE